MADKINVENFYKKVYKKVEEMINDYKNTKEKSYDPTEDVKDIVAMILDKFSNNKNYMNGIKTLIDKVQIDEENDTIFFEVEDGFDESDCEDCDDKENSCIIPTSTSEDKDYVSIFSELSVDDLNKAIKQFESEFEDKPYLIMSKDTLMFFEQYSDQYDIKNTCLEMDTDDVDCDDYEDCEGCPYEPDDEGKVVVEHECETGNVTASYLHNDNDYIIAIDNNLAFGVVKVR